MSKKIYGFCEAGCKYEVPGKEEVALKEEVVNKKELENYSKLADRIVTIPTSKLQTDTDIWNNGDPVFLNIDSASLKGKSISQSIGISGRLEIEIGYYYHEIAMGTPLAYTTESIEDVPFDLLWYMGGNDKRGRISYTKFIGANIFKIDIDLAFITNTLYIYNLSVGEFNAMTNGTTTSSSKYTDGKKTGDFETEPIAYVPKIKLNSLNVYFI